MAFLFLALSTDFGWTGNHFMILQGSSVCYWGCCSFSNIFKYSHLWKRGCSIVIISRDWHRAYTHPHNYRQGHTCIYRTMQIPKTCSHKNCVSQLFVLSTLDKDHSNWETIDVGAWAKITEISDIKYLQVKFKDGMLAIYSHNRIKGLNVWLFFVLKEKSVLTLLSWHWTK